MAMQLGLPRAIAPVEIFVGTERGRAPQFVIVEVEYWNGLQMLQ